MSISLAEILGKWNPQLWRELKYRLKRRNLAIATTISFIAQFLFLAPWLKKLKSAHYAQQAPFCTSDIYNTTKEEYSQLQQQYQLLQAEYAKYTSPEDYNPEKISLLYTQIAQVKVKMLELEQTIQQGCHPNNIALGLWWQAHALEIFAFLSVILTFILLVVGTYLLVKDFAAEKRRGTWNFIKSSPQSPRSILIGKMLGVPILLYLAVGLAIPLHLYLGISAKIPLLQIFCFYGLLVASCGFFFGAAILFSFSLSGLEAWLTSGLIFGLLFLFNYIFSRFDWLKLFFPLVLLSYWLNNPNLRDTSLSFPPEQSWQILKWYFLPIGTSFFGIVVFVLLNYIWWGSWIYQSLKRRFHNPKATLLSKKQSYSFAFCFQIFSWGFVFQQPLDFTVSSSWGALLALRLYFLLLSISNTFVVLALTAIISPNRQNLLKWLDSRKSKTVSRRRIWLKDLLVSEESPAFLAVIINLAIAVIPLLIVWEFLQFENREIDKFKLLLEIVLCCNWIWISATVLQLINITKNKSKKYSWFKNIAFAFLVFITVVIIFFVLVFTEFHTSIAEIFFTPVILGEFCLIILLHLVLINKVRGLEKVKILGRK